MNQRFGMCPRMEASEKSGDPSGRVAHESVSLQALTRRVTLLLNV